MKKHKQILIDHNTLESTAQNADSSNATPPNPQATESLESTAPKVDSSFKAMDRHADKSARDDNKKVDSIPQPTTPSQQDSTTQLTKAAGFADDFGGFQAVGEGIYLDDNEQAHRVESTKSAAKPTPKPRKAESSPTLCACSEFVYLGSLPYTLRLPTGKTYPLHQGDSFIVPQGDLSRYLEYKSTMFKKLR